MSEHTWRIELTESDYIYLMRIVMGYGSGTGEGTSSSTSLRLGLAKAQVVTHKPYEKSKFPEPRPVVIEGDA